MPDAKVTVAAKSDVPSSSSTGSGGATSSLSSRENADYVATSSSKRAVDPRRTSSGPKPPATIHPTVVVGAHAHLTGYHPVTIGARVVIHPYARVSSLKGPIMIGDEVVISERVCIGTRMSDTAAAAAAAIASATADAGADDAGRGEEDKELKSICIERGVTIEGDVVIEEESSIGEGTIIEMYAKVGRGCVVGKVTFRPLFPFLA